MFAQFIRIVTRYCVWHLSSPLLKESFFRRLSLSSPQNQSNWMLHDLSIAQQNVYENIKSLSALLRIKFMRLTTQRKLKYFSKVRTVSCQMLRTPIAHNTIHVCRHYCIILIALQTLLPCNHYCNNFCRDQTSYALCVTCQCQSKHIPHKQFKNE